MTKVTVVSDLHLEAVKWLSDVPDLGGGDLLILGGDILTVRHFKSENGDLRRIYTDFLAKCSLSFDKVLYLMGNHEYYGYNYEGASKTLRHFLPSNFQLMENDVYEHHDGTVFLGCTLWTNFCNANALDMMEARQCMNDYHTIRVTSKFRKLTPDDTLGFHRQSMEFLSERLKDYEDRKVWVLTHHGPSYLSVHPRYKSAGICNSAYVTELSGFIESHPQIRYWSHGHTHNSFDYTIAQCGVMCNPRGYVPDDVNPDFDPLFSVTLD